MRRGGRDLNLRDDDAVDAEPRDARLDVPSERHVRPPIEREDHVRPVRVLRPRSPCLIPV